MKSVKRNITVLVALVGVVSLTSCGGSGQSCDAYTNNYEVKEQQDLADRAAKVNATDYTPEWAAVKLEKENS